MPVSFEEFAEKSLLGHELLGCSARLRIPIDNRIVTLFEENRCNILVTDLRAMQCSTDRKEEPMGTTFVKIRRSGFWISDSLLELWLRFLALHIEDSTDSDTTVTSIRDKWLLASRGIFTGCVPDGLNEAISMPEGEALVRKAIDSLMKALASAPSHLNKDVLNLLGFLNGWFDGDIETRRLIEVGRAFQDLMDGIISAGPEDSALMPSSH